ncbi:MAG: SDR family NAD(P)-dependent oxidoreductase, partial [Pseudomonadota bacterium]
MAPSIRPWALVTGASGGLGEALAHEAAKDGNNVVLVARNGDKLEEIGCNIRAAHLVEVKPLIGDLVEPADIDALQNTLS